jgi:hypothetical protein
MKAYITDIAYFLPNKVLTNEQIAALFPEWSADKVASKVGITERHIAAADETATDMAYKAAEQLFALFNHRYDYNRPTIVTTNYSGADLVKRLTPRPDMQGYADDTTAQAIVDRLRGTAMAIILDGASKR